MDSIQEAMEEVVFGNETFSTPIPYSIMYMPWEANEVLYCEQNQWSDWVQCLGFVQLIRRTTRTKNQLYKNPNIA